MMRMNAVLRVFPLEKKAEEIDITRVGVNMPIGGDIVGIVPMGDQLGIAVICDVADALRTWHPLVMAVMDISIAPLLGRMFGKSIGLVPVAGKPTAILPDLPWPTSAIEAVTQGKG